MFAGIALIITGLLPLLFGRRLFWLFVGIAGFLVGYAFAAQLLPGQSDLFRWLISILLGLVFGGLAVALRPVMAAVAGFVALGGFGALLAASASLGDTAQNFVFLAMGLIGAIVVFRYFEWGVITVSSLNGASAILAGLALLVSYPAWLALLLGLVLVAIGIVFQGRDYEASQGISTA